MRRLLGGLGICTALLAATPAFWETRPFTKWSDAEAKQLMSNSPWAHEVSLEDPSAGWLSGGGTVGGGKGGRGGVSVPVGVSGPKIKVVVFWESSLPGRQALARMKFGAEAADSSAARSLLEQDNDNYSFIVTGLPTALVKQDLDKVRENLAVKTTLTVKGRPAAKPSRAELLENGRTLGFYFDFPRSFGITAADKEVEFSTHVAEIEIRTAFRPPEMIFGGKLEL